MAQLESDMGKLGLQDAEWEESSVFASLEVDEGGNEVEDEAAAEQAASDTPDDMTCAICLESTPITDIALVKGCEHQYCVHCILQWATCKEWCPQCKKPFDYLLTHRQLDGTLNDYLVEESVCLLKRARWFEDHMRAKEKGKAPMSAFDASRSRAYTDGGSAAGAAADVGDWADLYEDFVDAELEEDEEIESYYFSSAAGRARVVLGNRRWGEGGYMRAGRMYARPVVQNNATASTTGGGKGKGKGSGAASSNGTGSTSMGGKDSATGSSSASAAAEGQASARPASSSSSSRINASSAARNKPAVSVARWLDDDDDDDDEDDDDFCLDRRGAGSSSNSRSSSGGSRGLQRSGARLPKGSPANAAAGPLVTPLGKSPGSGGFTIGSWGAAGGLLGGPAAAGGSCSAGSTPGSGRRAKRNARRAAADAGGMLDFE